MNSCTLLLVIVTALFCPSGQQSSRCQLSRLDKYPCQYQNERLMRAGKNQYSIHETRLRLNEYNEIECNVRPSGQIVENITTIGSDKFKLLTSPGFTLNVPYDNRLLVEYNVQCDKGQVPYYKILDLQIQGRDCQTDEGTNLKCQDYINIKAGSQKEICGNIDSLPRSDRTKYLTENLTVYFRTSEEVVNSGFMMAVLCLDQADIDGPSECLKPSDFLATVCTESIIQNCGCEGASVIGNQQPTLLMEGTSQMVTYDSILYHLSGASNRVRRQKRQVGVLRFSIFSNDTVYYYNRTIDILRSNDSIDPLRHTEILMLQTFDVNGDTDTYIGGTQGDVIQNRQNFEGGLLVFAGRNAYFQMYIVDPSPAFSEEMVFNALKRLDSCDIFERAQARAVLQYFEGKRYAIRIQQLLNFTITCSLIDSKLHCKVDNGFAPVLPEHTTCQINDQQPMKCKPFDDTESFERITSVIVRAINCNGQRVEVTIEPSSFGG